MKPTISDSVTGSVTPLDAKTTASPAPPKFVRPNFEQMPSELRLLKNWVLWGAVWNGSKRTKRPIQVSGFAASTTNPKHWSFFDDVKREYERAVERGYIALREKDRSIQKVIIGGVGFVFNGEANKDGLVFAGVDFDSGAFNEDIASLSAERVKRFGSYVEASPSGNGVHVIVKARPLESGISHNGVELYTSGRYFTMTGQAGHAPLRIIAAPEAFATLAKELQAQSETSRKSAAPRDTKTGNAENTAVTNGWFSALPPRGQSEVVKYAALYIAKNSKLFELTKHGGTHSEYFKLTLAIARSGVADAEDIFVEAALTAKDADSEPVLRKFFQSCNKAGPRADGVTIGTLLHIASQLGADFSKWKQTAKSSDPDKVFFVPGNEAACRKRLDAEVAADPWTYTLGDPTGPLVILRVPDKDALPPETRWEGDLPGTTLAAPADVMLRAERIKWMRKGEDGRFHRARPPRDFISDYLTQLQGQYGARPLRGIIRVPRIDDDGTIRFLPGYDPQTGLFLDRSPTFKVPQHPSRGDARKAADVLLFPFSKYQFEDSAAGQALLLAAIFTAIERPFLPVAPMFVVRSSMPGTGKGKIVRSLVRLAFDTEPVAITWGGNSEEFEKRLAALLLRTPGVLSIDNANGMQIKGDLLESIITEGCADIRPLGHSKIVKVRNRSLVTLTGNNPIITGDMARRALSIDILPQSADPERDIYPFDPAEITRRRRTELLMAAFIAMRAFRLVGMPRQKLPAVGSFDDWSRKVRDLVYWLTDYDVSKAFQQNKAEDPRRLGDASLLAALHQHFGVNPFKAADPIAVHKRVKDQGRSTLQSPAPTAAEQALHDAIEDVLGSQKANDAKTFGYWARRIKGARIEGFILETHHNSVTNANDITVRRTLQRLSPGSTGSTGSIQPLHEMEKSK